MTSTRTLRILLALVLLAVWQAALLHPLRHVDAKGAFVHVPGSHLPKSPGDKSGSSASCDAIAAVTACISGASPADVFAVDESDRVIRRHADAPLRAPAPAYQSQAPPTLL